jgi:putative hydrolase of the HAD superfamily
MIRTVISDMGKVIVHFDNRIFFTRLSASCGLTVEDIIRCAFQGTGLFNAFDAGALDPEGFQAEVCGRLGIDLPRDEFYTYYNEIFRLIPGTLPVLNRARKTCRLMLLSNTDPMRFAYIQRTFPEVRVFDASVVSFVEKLMKPDPRIFALALTRAQALPAECVFIDDRPENVAAAAAFGVEGIVFEEGATDLEAELEKLGVEL